MYKAFLFSIIIFSLNGCDTNTKTKSLISTIEKINSLDNQYSVYKYYVQASMAFTSGSVRINILKANQPFDFEASDYFLLDNHVSPLILGWKNSKTLKMIGLTTGEIGGSEPYKKEMKQFKGFNIEINYYHIFGSGANPIVADTFQIQGDTVSFIYNDQQKSFVKGQVEISYSPGAFNISEIQIDSSGKFWKDKSPVVLRTNWQFSISGQFGLPAFILHNILLKQDF